jgi:Flp pilus assembly protein TadG
MKRVKGRWERGQSFVEMAFGMVVLVILLGGLIDLGRAFLILVSVENAAGEGALFGATHPTCLTDDHAPTACVGDENVVARVQEEGKPIIDLTSANSTIDIFDDDINLTDSPPIVGGATLKIKVVYHYSPVTPLGFLIWGNQAEVRAEASQELLSPPPPWSQYRP